jgi:NTE family protein
MVFHIGAVWRLYETGLLAKLTRVSSVSGGSMTAGVLGVKWPVLKVNQPDRAVFEREFVAPLRGLAGETIDADSILIGLLTPGRISDRIASAYDRYLFKGKTLQDLPDAPPAPRFIINATNVQSGVLWRFSKPYMADYRVGMVKDPKLALAQAVAASSAFPPVLSPFEMRLDPTTVEATKGADLHKEPYTSRVLLTDGGVYDNLGLETVWKSCETVFVSDGGGKFEGEEEPHSDWARHSIRVLNLIDSQVRALRNRQVIGSYLAPPQDEIKRTGAYWGVRTAISEYEINDALPAPLPKTTELAATSTRLKRMSPELQERLINWGYAVCDAAIRRYYDAKVKPAPKFPYDRGV